MAEDHEDRPIEIETMGAESGDAHTMMADNIPDDLTSSIPSVVKNASLMIPLNNTQSIAAEADMDFTRGEDLFD